MTKHMYVCTYIYIYIYIHIYTQGRRRETALTTHLCPSLRISVCEKEKEKINKHNICIHKKIMTYRKQRRNNSTINKHINNNSNNNI